VLSEINGETALGVVVKEDGSRVIEVRQIESGE
jgi:hypothetical protein